MANPVDAVLEKYIRQHQYLTALAQPAIDVKDDRTLMENDAVNAVINRGMPSLLYLKCVTILQKLIDDLWRAFFPTVEKIPKRPQKIEELRLAMFALDSESLKILDDIRNDIAHELTAETDWETFDTCQQHLSLFLLKIKLWSRKNPDVQ